MMSTIGNSADEVNISASPRCPSNEDNANCWIAEEFLHFSIDDPHKYVDAETALASHGKQS